MTTSRTAAPEEYVVHGQPGGLRTPKAGQAARLLERMALIAWSVTVCVLSQLPYRYVWLGKFTYVYDAFTTFSPWNVSRLHEFRSGEGLLKMSQDNLPTDVWPSYYFTGLVRQITALLQPNTPIAHAIVQALHALLLVPAVGLLFRSFGVPFRYGIVGGLIFGLSGLHVSLAHHVLAHEALLYLVLSLWSLRELIMADPRSGRRQTLLWAAASGVMLASLVRVHHEAVLYFLPVAAWVVAHLWLAGARDGYRLLSRKAVTLAIAGILVGLSAIPMLITAFEMSLTNKTLIQSYSDLGPYFPSMRVFLLALSLRNFTGGASGTFPPPFSFGQESTLSYIFAGSLSAAFLITVVAAAAHERRWREALMLITSTVVLLGYTFGVGSPIHRALCALFPFLIDIGHNYYGLHLLYLVTGFGVARGLQLLAQGHYWRTFVVAQAGVFAAVLYFALRAIAQDGPGVSGSFPDFRMAVQYDTRWLALCTVAALVAALIVPIARRVRPGGNVRFVSVFVVILLTSVLALDLLKPTVNAHFVPNEQWVTWEKHPLGGFNPSKPIVEYFAKYSEGKTQVVRVLPIFPKAGGWQSNALLPMSTVKILHMPSDTGGNRAISTRLEQEPTPAIVQSMIDDFGVEAFWVARWGAAPWAAALASTPSVRLAKSAEYGGDVYLVDSEGEQAMQHASGAHWVVPWHDSATKIDQGLVARRWTFPLASGAVGRKANMPVQLPLMWHAAYGVEQQGKRLKFTTDDLGRVLVLGVDPAAGPLVVQYPSPSLSALVVVAALAYFVMLAVWVGAFAYPTWVRYRKRRRESPRNSSNQRPLAGHPQG